MGVLSEFQKKPDHIKKKYSFLGAVLVTLSIAFVWATSLPARFSTINNSITSDTETQSATLSKGFMDLVENTREEFDSVRDIEEGGSEGGELMMPDVAEESTFSIGSAGTPSAYQNLNTWEVGTISDNETNDAIIADPIPPTVTREEEKVVPILPQSASNTPSVPIGVTTPAPTPKPTVILIGTTTSKKSE